MNREKIKSMTFTALTAALLCVVGPLTIPLPFSPVPITFANLIIYICTITVGMKRGTAAVLLYILIGAVGLPVFSRFTSGIGIVLGPTGGYIIGYIFIALITGLFVKLFKGKVYMYVLGMIIGTAVCYAFGSVWLYVTNEKVDSFTAALALGVLPYIPGDAIKIIIAALTGETIRRAVDRKS